MMSVNVSKAVLAHPYFDVRPIDDKTGDGLLLRIAVITQVIVDIIIYKVKRMDILLDTIWLFLLMDMIVGIVW